LGSWISIHLEGQAIGARVIVTACGKRQVDEVRAGGSYLSQHDTRLHFGLGGCSSVDELTVRWPSGQEARRSGLAANREHRIAPTATAQGR
jgi:hypothetical protein